MSDGQILDADPDENIVRIQPISTPLLGGILHSTIDADPDEETCAEVSDGQIIDADPDENIVRIQPISTPSLGGILHSMRFVP